MAIPELNERGDLPAGVHRATLAQTIARFGHGSLQRQAVAHRLAKLYELVADTGQLARFIVFGSFVTAKADPNDIDVVLIMNDEFDLTKSHGESALVFHHTEADAHFGASVFWVRRPVAFGGEQSMVEWRAIDSRILADSSRRRVSRHPRNYLGIAMISNDRELQTTLDRIAWFQKQLAALRQTETNPSNYRASSAGFLLEIDRMQLEVREYFSFLPSETAGAA